MNFHLLKIYNDYRLIGNVTWITASAPSGTGAPVVILAIFPGVTLNSGITPAVTVAITSNFPSPSWNFNEFS